MFLWKTISFLTIVALSSSARILGVVPTPSYSHQVVFQPIWRELSLKGHQLTVLTTDPMKDPLLGNVKEIDLSFAYQLWKIKHNITDIINTAQESLLKYIDRYVAMIDDIIDQELQHPEVQNLIKNETEYFDLLILEFPYPTMTAFSERFKCPFIGMTSLDAHSIVYDGVGNPSHPVLNPDFSLPYFGSLSFKERLLSALFQTYIRIYVHMYSYPKEDLVVKKYFGNGYSPLKEIAKRVSMLFVNVDPIFHSIRPIVPAVIQIGGGTHIKARKTLPHHLQNFLDDASEGVIYFSLGTNVQSADLPKKTRKILLETFNELPYKVLWKYEAEDLPGKTANILTSKWFPQQDIFRHKNIKLFITQGGLQSMEEAIYNHIPLIGIPFFGDQPTNVAIIVAKGFGLSIDHKRLNKKDFKNTILEVIKNPKYRNKAKELTQLASDQPMTGLERAIWWTEYVIRHKGAKHLRSPAIDLPLYQYFLLDVIGFCLLVALVIVYVFIKLVKIMFKIMCRFNLKVQLIGTILFVSLSFLIHLCNK